MKKLSKEWLKKWVKSTVNTKTSPVDRQARRQLCKLIELQEPSEKELEWLMIWRSNCLNAHAEHEAIGDCENCQSYTDCKEAYDKLRKGR